MSGPVQPNRRDNLFRISFPGSKDKKVVRVSLNPDVPSVPPEVIQRALKAIEQPLDSTPPSLNQMRITKYEDSKKLDYTYNGDVKIILLNTEVASDSNITVDIIPGFSSPAKASKMHSVAKQWDKLIPKEGLTRGLAIFCLCIASLLTVFILPIVVTAMGISDYQKKVARKIGEFDISLGGNGPSGPDTLIETLRTIQKTIEKRDNKDLYKNLNVWITAAKDLQQCALGGIERDAFIRPFLEKIENSLAASFVLPCGFYEGEEYQPALLVMHRKREGSYVVEKHILMAGGIAELSKVNVTQTFHFTTKEEVGKFLNALVDLQRRVDPSELSAAQKKQAQVLFISPSKVDPQERLDQKNLVRADLIAETLVLCGGALQEASPTDKVKTPSKDPMSLLGVFFKDNKEAQEVGLGDKALFFMHVVSQTSRSLEKYWDALSPEKRIGYASHLAVRLEELEKMLIRAYGNGVATGIVGPIKKGAEKFKKSVDQKVLSSRESERIQALEENPKTAPLQLFWNQPGIPSEGSLSAVQQTGQIAGIASKRKELLSLRAAFKNKAPSEGDVNKICTEANALVDLGETLIDAKDYIQGRTCAHAFLKTMPLLGEEGVFTNFTSEQLAVYGKLLTQACQQIFETKFRLGHASASSEEAVLLFSVRSLQTQMKDIQIQKLQERFKTNLSADQKRKLLTADTKESWDRFFGVNRWKESPTPSCLSVIEMNRLGVAAKEGGLTLEECKILSTVNFIPDLYQGKLIIKKDLCFAPSTDADLAERVNALRTFRQMPKEKDKFLVDRVLSWETLKDSSAKDYLLGLQAILQGFEHPDGTGPVATEVSEVLINAYQTQIDDEGLLPPMVVNWKKEEFFTQCVLHPEHSLYLAFKTQIDAGLWFLKAQAKAVRELEDPSDVPLKIKTLQAIQQSQLREKLSTIEGRLKITTSPSTLDQDKTPCIRVGDETNGFYYYPDELPGTLGSYTSPANKQIYLSSLGPIPEEIALRRGGIPCDWIIEEVRDRVLVEAPEILFPSRALIESKETPSTILDPLYESTLKTMLSDECNCVKNAIAFCMQNPHLLEIDFVQARILQVLNGADYFLMEMHIDPTYFVNAIEGLKKIIEQALGSNKVKTAAFLLHIATQIKDSAMKAAPKWDVDSPDYRWMEKQRPFALFYLKEIEDGNELKTLIEKNQAAFVRLNAVSSFNLEWKKVLENLSTSLGSSDTLKAGLYFLNALKAAIPAGTPLREAPAGIAALKEMDIQNASEAEKQQVFAIWDRIHKNACSSKFPFLLSKVTQHMEENILPIIGEQAPKLAKQGIKEEGEFDVDLPEEVVTDKHYSKIFGQKMFKCRYENKGTYEVFIFKVGDTEFKVEKNLITKEVSRISQKIKDILYVHVEPKCKELANVGLLLQDKGMWIQENDPTQGLLIIPSIGSIKGDILEDPRVLRLELTGKQELVKIQTNTGKVVCQDSVGDYTRWFPSSHESNVLFLRDLKGDDFFGDKQINEIYFLDSGFSLKKERESLPLGDHMEHPTIWIPSGKGSGWQYQTTGTQWLSTQFGGSFEECMIPLVKNQGTASEELEIRVSPHPIIPASGNDWGTKKIEFVKAPSGNAFGKQLVISFNAKKEMNASHAGFLYLAYHCFARGDLDQAGFYLEQLSGKNITLDSSEGPLLDYLGEQLFIHPAYSTRAQAFLLKAELKLAKIQREQFKQSLYKQDWEKLHRRMDRILPLYQAYTKESGDPQKVARLNRSKLLLTDDEREELNNMKDHCIRNIINLPSTQGTVTASLLGSFGFEKPTSLNNCPEFMNYLILLGKEPDPKAIFASLQKEGIVLSSKQMLENFWTYWRVIQKDKISPERLAILMGPIPQADEMDSDLVKAIDFARKMLLTLSKMQLEEPLALPPASSFESVSPILAAYRLKKGKDPEGRAFLTEPMGPGGIALWNFLKSGAHKGTLHHVQKAFENVFKSFFDASAALDSRIGSELGIPLENEISVQDFKEKINGSGIPDEEKQMYLLALKSIPENRERRPLIELLKKLHEAKIPITTKRAEQAALKRIEALEQAQAAPVRQEPAQINLTELVKSNKAISDPQIWGSALEAKADVYSRMQPIITRAEALKTQFQDGENDSSMKKLENSRICQGIDYAKKEQLALVSHEGGKAFDEKKVEACIGALKNRIAELSNETKTIRTAVVALIEPHAADLGLYIQYANRNQFNDQAIFNAILDLYQDGKLNGITDAEKQITEFLFQAVKLQLFEKAINDDSGSFAQLKSLDPASLEWRSVSAEILKKCNRAVDLTFFSMNQNEPKLDKPNAKPMLVFSYRQNIGITREQVETIEQIIGTPNALTELRMGLGKSSVIFPLVARLLADQGKFATVIFTEELIEQSRKDMDKRAYEFQFQRSPDLSAGELAETYRTLLEVKLDKKYVITTSSRLAALENKFHELNKKMSEEKTAYDKLEKKLEEGPKNKKLVEQQARSYSRLVDLETKKEWIRKIYSVFGGLDARFLVDEVDAIFNISLEQNYSEGLAENVDELTFNTGEKIFKIIFESAHPSIEKLKKCFLANTQATLSLQEVQEATKEIGKKLQSDFPALANVNSEEFGKYVASIVVGSNVAPLPKGMEELAPTEAEAIGAVRHWLSKTLPTLCKKRLGLDFDISKDGYSVTPRQEEREKPNTKFGQEAELTGYHQLTYYCKAPSQEFFKRILPEIEAQNSVDAWKKWRNLLGNEDQYVAFSADTPTGQELRSGFLRFVMQNQNYIQVHREQITCRVQDLIAARQVAGASGSMNRYAMPASFQQLADPSQDPRFVTGDLLMRLSEMDTGLEVPVATFGDPIAQMTALLEDKTCKAIINLGTTSPGKTTVDVIKTLRETKPGKNKQFIFIHPQKKTAYFWNKGAAAPIPFDKVRDARLVDPTTCVYYFAPADIRGTDFKIPSGYGALITGPTTTLPLMEQAAWRLRKLGMGQGLKFCIETALAERIKTAQKVAVVTLKNVFEDILSQTMQEDSVINFKAQTARPQSIWIKEVKQVLFNPSKIVLKPQEKEAFLTRVDSEIEMYKKTKSLFFAEKKMNYLQDYTLAEMQKTTDYITAAYEAKGSELANVIPSLKEAAKKAIAEINEAKSEFIKSKESHKAHLPPLVAKNISLDAGSEAQTEQETAQQTEQQQQQSVEASYLTPGRRGKRALYDDPSEDSFCLSTLHFPAAGWSFSNIEECFNNCGLSGLLWMTQSFSNFFKTSGSQGKALGSFMVIQQKPLAATPNIIPDIEGILLSSLDSFTCRPDEDQSFTTQLKFGSGVIYSFKYEDPYVDIQNSFGEPLEKNEAYHRLLGQAKLIMGFADKQFSPDEITALKAWFKKLPPDQQGNLNAALGKRMAGDAVKMLSSWAAE